MNKVKVTLSPQAKKDLKDLLAVVISFSDIRSKHLIHVSNFAKLLYKQGLIDGLKMGAK